MSELWYGFDSLESFENWHELKKQELGYPLQIVNHLGQPIEGKFRDWIVKPVILAENDVRILILPELAEGLTESEPIPEPPHASTQIIQG